MKIAVTSQNFRTVTGHAGRARRFLIYDAAPGADPAETGRLDLPLDQTFHESGDAGDHPIDGVDVLLSAGFGDHFVEVMARRGIRTAATDKEDPAEAVRDYLVRFADGTVPAVAGCDCGDRCGHAHEHGQEHGEDPQRP
jgi:predicted Fe-Mo cluster-binding NifX family protein